MIKRRRGSAEGNAGSPRDAEAGGARYLGAAAELARLLLDGAIHNNPYDNSTDVAVPGALQEVRRDELAESQSGFHSAKRSSRDKAGPISPWGLFEFFRHHGSTHEPLRAVDTARQAAREAEAQSAAAPSAVRS